MMKAKRKGSQTLYIGDQDGNLIRAGEREEKKWNEYFSDMLNEFAEERMEEVSRESVRGRPEEDEVEESTTGEIKKIIRSVGTNATPCNNDITEKILQYGEER